MTSLQPTITEVTLGGVACPARWWRPGHPLPTGPLACDTETTAIPAGRPWETPRLVLLVAANPRDVVFVGAGQAAAFLAALPADTVTAWHHFAFDYHVLKAAGADLAARVEANTVYDTMLLHRLYALATEGHTARKQGEATLENCADVYCGFTLPKDPADRDGRPIRTGFGRWLGRRPADVWPEYLEYAGKDALATRLVAAELMKRVHALRTSPAADPHQVLTYLGAGWLADAWRRWGPLTHHIQLKAAIVFAAMERDGLRVDRDRAAVVRGELEGAQEAALNRLAVFGYVPGKGSGARLQALLAEAERQLGVTLPRTKKDRKISARADDLAPYADKLPFLAALKDLSFAAKMVRTYADKLLREDGRDHLHPRYDLLKVTGRVSAGGELGYMSVPRAADGGGPAGRLRGCVVPRPGHTFVDHDFGMIELVTWAAVQLALYGESALADALRAGGDLHARTAAGIAGKPEGAVTKAERKAAKAVSFGIMGGLGAATLAAYVNKSFAPAEQITLEQAGGLKAAWQALYPEARAYLAEEKSHPAGGNWKAGPDPGRQAAEWFGLTPAALKAAAGLDWFRDAPADEPHGAFGNMLFKCLEMPAPANAAGRPYDPAVVEFLWAAVRQAADAGTLPGGLLAFRPHIRARRPSPELGAAARGCFGRGPVWTLTGRLRGQATYTQRCNTPCQGLAADGLKLVLWRLYREGLRPVLAVHDQLVVEAPAGAAAATSGRVQAVMVEEMKALVGDLPVTAPGEVRDRWG